ncbi:N-acetylmuramoyl-L-alanine amidase [Paenibacillus sp. TAF58]
MHPKRRRLKIRRVRFVVVLFGLLLLGGSLLVATLDNQNQHPTSSVPGIELKEIQSLNPPGLALKEMKSKRVYSIVIDPGHGGKDPGAKGASGSYEKKITLSLSLKVYDLLKQEDIFDPHLTRTDDTFIPLEDRANMANNMKADAFISIHGNTYEDKSAGGTLTFYRYDKSIQLAQIIQSNVVKAMGFRDRGVQNDKLMVLSLSNMPAILIEVGYMTNPKEEAVILGKEGQDRAAHAIVEGLKKYFAEHPQKAAS